jgi:hypothetical protein
LHRFGVGIIVFLVLGLQGFTQNDSTSKVTRFIHNTFPQGSITAGYDYGLLPFLVQVNPPQGNFKTQGQFTIQAKSLPFNASFFYSSVGTISGLNNYFRVQFDAQRYQQQLKEKFLKSQLDKAEQLKDLQRTKQQLTQRLGYLDLVKSGKIQIPIKPSLPLPTLPDVPTLDSLGMPTIPNVTVDSLLHNVTVPDVPNVQQYMGWNDSLAGVHSLIMEQLSTINSQMAQLEKYKNLNGDSLFHTGNYPAEFNTSKFTKYLSHNNIFFTNNLVNNNLNAARNLYNFFDFNNIEDGRKVTALKLGYGTKEGSHLFVGGLFGEGRVSYFDSLRADVERNVVVEIDGRYVFKNHSLDVIYGRSATQVNNVNYEDQDAPFNQLFNFQFNTNAFLARNTLSFKKTGTTIKLTFRYIDPFFRSFGVGFIRSDNMRYEAKVEQVLSKKLKIGGFYRHEEDNLLNLYTYKNRLESYGANITYRPTKHWMLKGDYRPIVQQVDGQADSLQFTNRNYIVNVISTYQNRIKDVHYNLMAVYSFYQLFNGAQNNVYQNINASFIIRDKSRWQNSLSYNYFITSEDIGIPPTNVLLEELSFKANKIELAGKGKLAFSAANGVDVGYGLRATIQIYKKLSYELSGEKLVFGDFYNSLALQSLESFPYFFNTSLKLTW